MNGMKTYGHVLVPSQACWMHLADDCLPVLVLETQKLRGSVLLCMYPYVFIPF